MYKAETYLEIAGILSVCVCCIVYCAVNWDDPPEWWPRCLQNKYEINLNEKLQNNEEYDKL